MSVGIGDTGLLVDILGKLGVKDSGKTAERLLERFGSLSGVFAATREELGLLGCLTERAAAFLAFVGPMLRRTALGRASRRLDGERAIVRYATAYFLLNTSPFSACYCVFTRDRRPISTEPILSESIAREAVGRACRLCADGVIVMRYRPSVDGMTPSADELAETERLAALCELTGKEFIDYVEFTPYRFYSYRRATSGDGGITDIFDAK